MIDIGMLDRHPSSPTKACGNPDALAQRLDLYTGDDFYFGFASSNHTFLDIIGGHQPLAIKHGPILSLYHHHGAGGYTCQTYYIDAKAKALLPVIHIVANPVAVGIFEQLLPWSFTDFYLHTLDHSDEQETTSDRGPGAEESVRSVLDKLAKNGSPDDGEISRLHDAVASILAGQDGLNITLGDFAELKRCTQQECKVPSADDFVADYNPFYNNVKIPISFLREKNANLITVRQINDRFPRIEAIVPGVSRDGLLAVFKAKNSALYSALQTSLAEPAAISRLLKEHFPERVEQYYVENGIHSPQALGAGITSP